MAEAIEYPHTVPAGIANTAPPASNMDRSLSDPSGQGDRFTDHFGKPSAEASSQPQKAFPVRPRVILEVLVVMGVVGLLLEIADGHPWPVIAAGAAAAIWLMARSH